MKSLLCKALVVCWGGTPSLWTLSVTELLVFVGNQLFLVTPLSNSKSCCPTCVLCNSNSIFCYAVAGRCLDLLAVIICGNPQCCLCTQFCSTDFNSSFVFSRCLFDSISTTNVLTFGASAVLWSAGSGSSRLGMHCGGHDGETCLDGWTGERQTAHNVHKASPHSLKTASHCLDTACRNRLSEFCVHLLRPRPASLFTLRSS